MASPDSVPDADDPLALLSERQRTCLLLAAEGLTSPQIAARLGLSPRTVDEHLALACQGLGVRTRVQAVALVARHRRDTACVGLEAGLRVIVETGPCR